MASASVAADFHGRFQSQKQGELPVDPLLGLKAARRGRDTDSIEISSRLNDAKGHDQQSIAAIASALTVLKTDLTQILPMLPLYDQSQYDRQVTELESKLSALRAKNKPKSRFAFSKSTSAPNAPAVTGSILTPDSGPSRSSSITPTPSDSIAAASSNVSGSYTSVSTFRENIHVIRNIRRGVIRPPSTARDAYTLSLDSIEDCVVDLRPGSNGDGENEVNTGGGETLTSLHGKSLRRCVLLAPAVTGSVILDGIEDSLLVLGCQQFRIHSSHRTAVLLHVTSNPVIEHSSTLFFGHYPTFLHSSPRTLQSPSKHGDVQDFDWVKSGRSPNWVALGDVASSLLFTKEDAAAIAGPMVKENAEEVESMVARLTGAIDGISSFHA